jgi:hypothetical protein
MRNPLLQEVHGIRWPDRVEILHTYSGKEYDHLGIGLAALGDVDGDGIDDFAIGAMKWAYCFGFGPGYVEVHSGRDGALLYRVDGTDGEHGDAYGDTISPIGDVDGDERPDWAAGAWRWNGYCGYLALYSGVTGKVIYTLTGGAKGPSDLLLGRMPEPSTCDMGFGPAMGRPIAPAGDVDGDGRADLFTAHWIVSGKDGRTILETEGRLLDLTSDVDGDGRRDWLMVHDSEDGVRLAVHSSSDGKELHPLAVRPDAGPFDYVATAGDVDRDGWTDVLLARPDDTDLVVQLVSGRDGASILDWRQVHDVHETPLVCVAGDMNGDGATDFLTRTGSIGGTVLLIVRSGRNGGEMFRILAEHRHLGDHAVALGDLDGDGRGEFLISEYEACVDATKCCGAAYVLSYRGH